MAIFETVVRSRARDFNTVYIRVAHNGKSDYIKTSLLASPKQLRGNIVKDNLILIQSHSMIKEYVEKLNTIDCRNMSVKEVIAFLESGGEDISFTDFYEEFLLQMGRDGRDNPATNYRTALNSLKRFMSGSDDLEYSISFSDLKRNVIRDWIKSLEQTARAKSMYPRLIQAVFNAGLDRYNDYDNGVLLIKNNPFRGVVIPREDAPVKRWVDKDTVQAVFNCETEQGSRAELAQDVGRFILFLVGINTVDLFLLKKSNYSNGKLKYNRHKTSKSRSDRAYIEITVPEELLTIFVKYAGAGDNLFSFSERYSDFNAFNSNVNKGFKTIRNELDLDSNITTYTFRHTWSNMAKSVFHASTELIGYCLNHASAHRTTELYIDKDFSRIDDLNRKIVNYINIYV